jgi:ketosteroid isomerase-like protein
MTPVADAADIAARLDRVESYQAIAQLPARYALALDARDAKRWAALYVPDIKVGAPIHGVGRQALEQWFFAKCSYWYRSLHHIGAHDIVFDDADHARGEVQCRVEQEIGHDLVTTVVLYRDAYERRDGEWLFAHRRGLPLWCYCHGEDPIATGLDGLPTGMPIRLPAENAAFAAFWEHFDDEQIAAVTTHPIGRAGRP